MLSARCTPKQVSYMLALARKKVHHKVNVICDLKISAAFYVCIKRQALGKRYSESARLTPHDATRWQGVVLCLLD